MEAIARLRYLQASPQKVRLVADLIRGRDVEEASTLLQLSTKAAARPIGRVAANRHTQIPQVDADLIGAAGVGADFEEQTILGGLRFAF